MHVNAIYSWHFFFMLALSIPSHHVYFLFYFLFCSFHFTFAFFYFFYYFFVVVGNNRENQRSKNLEKKENRKVRGWKSLLENKLQKTVPFFFSFFERLIHQIKLWKRGLMLECVTHILVQNGLLHGPFLYMHILWSWIPDT